MPLSHPPTVSAGPGGNALGAYGAALLVFGSSAAVLVIEITSLRLLAPLLGLTLETSTMVIGTALAAIALGAWAGGRAADQIPPRRALAPLLAISGIAVALTPFGVRGAAAIDANLLLTGVIALSIIVPGALLSAVSPMVTKLRLTSLGATGTVVGQLSGIGTAGAIVGTVVTGFVLISRVPVSGILVGLGVTLVLGAAVVAWSERRRRASVVPVVVVLVAALGAAVTPHGCDAETKYHCASVVRDPHRAGGRTLYLDGLPHSYIDLDDPTHLEYAYAQAMAAVLDAAFGPNRPLRAHHIGGGAATLPRYLAATRPGSISVVSEIDPGVVAIDRKRLGLVTGPDLLVRVEDGRLGISNVTAASQDLVVGDAFGGISVPWHLATVEAAQDIRRSLTPDGVYVLNMIDHPPLAFARAELATVSAVFTDVALLAEADTIDGTDGGNLVIVASDRPLDLAAVTAQSAERGSPWRALSGSEAAAWAGSARPLVDDFAPVDQLLTPYGAR